MKTKYTYELLSPIIKDSLSIGAVLDKLGLMRTGGNYSHISKKIKIANIDVSHFKGQGWSKGLNEETSKSVKQHTIARRLSNDEVFIKNSTYKSSGLYKRLLLLGIDCVCAHCSTSNTWEGNPLRLHVDHIDGDNTNHVISNLRLLCPNCHSQTSTYCGRNIKIKNVVRPVITSISPNHLKLKIPRHCIECNKEIRAANKSGLCRDCCNKKQQKVNRPSKEHLINLLSNSTFLSISKQFNVRDNTIRKWCKQYGMNPKEYGRAAIIANKK